MTEPSSSPSHRPLHIVTLCTGNATRSVIAQLWLQRARPQWLVTGGGTLSIEGQPMSIRTRSALSRIGLVDPGHRSHQLVPADALGADLVLAMEADHVEWIRREIPEAADRTVTLRRLLRDLPDASNEGRDLSERLADISPGEVTTESWEDVIDPAGGEQPEFDRCADELDELLTQLLPKLG